MTFKLQPGDWIPTSEVPEDKLQAVIDAFAAAGAKLPDRWWRDPDESMSIDWCDVTNELDFFSDNDPGSRRVTLKQILGEQSPSWDEVGPELLAALEHVTEYSMFAKMDDDSQEMVNRAITKARSIT